MAHLRAIIAVYHFLILKYSSSKVRVLSFDNVKIFDSVKKFGSVGRVGGGDIQRGVCRNKGSVFPPKIKIP